MADLSIKWTDVLTALATTAASIGTLVTLIFFGLQLRIQNRGLQDQRESADRNLAAVSEQIAAQAQQIRHLAEQTRLQTEQAEHVAEQTKLIAQQTGLLADTNRSVLYQNVMKEMQEISKIFLSEPDLRHYFYSGKNIPHDPSMRMKVEILSEMFVDFMAYTLNTNVLFDEDEREGWRSYFQDITTTSPSIQKFWKEHRDWYEVAVKEVLDPVVKAADAGVQSAEDR